MAGKIDLTINGKPLVLALVTQDDKERVLHWLRMRIITEAAEAATLTSTNAARSLIMREAHLAAASVSWTMSGIEEMACSPEAMLFTLWLAQDNAGGALDLAAITALFGHDISGITRAWIALCRASGMVRRPDEGDSPDAGGQPPKKAPGAAAPAPGATS